MIVCPSLYLAPTIVSPSNDRFAILPLATTKFKICGKFCSFQQESNLSSPQPWSLENTLEEL
jgi:hypothetical protein